MYYILGDCKEYYGFVGSIWDMVNCVFEECKKCEIDLIFSLFCDNILEEVYIDDECFV